MLNLDNAQHKKCLLKATNIFLRNSKKMSNFFIYRVQLFLEFSPQIDLDVSVYNRDMLTVPSHFPFFSHDMLTASHFLSRINKCIKVEECKHENEICFNYGHNIKIDQENGLCKVHNILLPVGEIIYTMYEDCDKNEDQFFISKFTFNIGLKGVFYGIVALIRHFAQNNVFLDIDVDCENININDGEGVIISDQTLVAKSRELINVFVVPFLTELSQIINAINNRTTNVYVTKLFDNVIRFLNNQNYEGSQDINRYIGENNLKLIEYINHLLDSFFYIEGYQYGDCSVCEEKSSFEEGSLDKIIDNKKYDFEQERHCLSSFYETLPPELCHNFRLMMLDPCMQCRDVLYWEVMMMILSNQCFLFYTFFLDNSFFDNPVDVDCFLKNLVSAKSMVGSYSLCGNDYSEKSMLMQEVFDSKLWHDFGKITEALIMILPDNRHYLAQLSKMHSYNSSLCVKFCYLQNLCCYPDECRFFENRKLCDSIFDNLLNKYEIGDITLISCSQDQTVSGTLPFKIGNNDKKNLLTSATKYGYDFAFMLEIRCAIGAKFDTEIKLDYKFSIVFAMKYEKQLNDSIFNDVNLPHSNVDEINISGLVNAIKKCSMF